MKLFHKIGRRKLAILFITFFIYFLGEMIFWLLTACPQKVDFAFQIREATIFERLQCSLNNTSLFALWPLSIIWSFSLRTFSDPGSWLGTGFFILFTIIGMLHILGFILLFFIITRVANKFFPQKISKKK